MTKKEALHKVLALIKKTLFADDAPAMKLSDGTVVQSTLEPGSPIAFLNEDGTAVPAAVGEYELEDARIVVVAEEGIVAEVKEPAPAPDAPTEEEPLSAAALAEMESKLTAASTELAQVKADFSAHKTAAEKFQADTNELLKQMNAFLEILTKEEGGTPAGEVRQTAFAAKRAEKAEAREKMLNGFKKFAERIKK